MAGTSPPGPLRCGSTTCRVKAVATAASKALPPFSNVAMPTAVAIQCVEATTPKVPSISGRVGKGLGLILLIGICSGHLRVQKGRYFTTTAALDQGVQRGIAFHCRSYEIGGPHARH